MARVPLLFHTAPGCRPAVDVGATKVLCPYDIIASISLCTNSVVAITEDSVPTAAVGAVGEPVNDGDAKKAKP